MAKPPGQIARPGWGTGRVRSGPRLRMRQAKTMRTVNRIL